MSDKARVHSRFNATNNLEFFDQSTHERVFALAGLFYEDDFLAAGKQAFPTTATQGIDWVKKLVETSGTPSVAGVASGQFGQVQLALDATSEKQEATLYWADNKHLDPTKGFEFECRAALSVLPSTAGVEAVFGVAGSWIDGPDNNTEYLEFGASGNGTMLMRSQDGSTQNAISTGVTVTAGVFHIFRIDASNTQDVGYYIDGVRYSTAGQIKFGATGLLQPYLSVYKPSGTGVATLVVDYVRLFSNRA